MHERKKKWIQEMTQKAESLERQGIKTNIVDDTVSKELENPIYDSKPRKEFEPESTRNWDALKNLKKQPKEE